MAERLEMAADPLGRWRPAELILDAGIGTFGRASLVIGQVPGIGDFDQPAPRALGGDFGLERGIAAGVAVDHRNPAGGDAMMAKRQIPCQLFAHRHICADSRRHRHPHGETQLVMAIQALIRCR